MVTATMRNGETVQFDVPHARDVVKRANGESLTGVADTMDSVWLKTTNGSWVRYGDIEKLTEE